MIIVTNVTGVMDVMDVTNVTGVMDVTNVTGVMDVMGPVYIENLSFTSILLRNEKPLPGMAEKSSYSFCT